MNDTASAVRGGSPQITPINELLTARGRANDLEGGKVFISSIMAAADDTSLSETNRLIIRPLPH